MVIDAHIHYTPPSLKNELSSLNEPYLQMLMGGNKSIQDWVSAETLIIDMDRANINQVVIVGEYFQRHDNCVRRNSQILELINRYPDRIIGYAILQPNAGQAALDELDRCLAGGMTGVGELNPYAQNFRLDSPEMSRIAEVCIGRNIPINFHVGEPIGGYYTGKSTTTLDDYYDLAVRYPALKLIFAHWGGGLLFYENMPRVRKQMQNVWYDTAASPLLYPTKRIFKTALTCVAPHKLLYGSDYPLRIYPGKMPKADFDPFLAAIRKQPFFEDGFLPDFFANNYLEMAAKDTASTHQPASDLAADLSPQSIGNLSIRFVTQTWPETLDIFGRYQIPTAHQPVPNFEPIHQAANALGLSKDQKEALIAELTEIILTDDR